jgi:pimeloyl-ACP methyl ester carboxylesterase
VGAIGCAPVGTVLADGEPEGGSMQIVDEAIDKGVVERRFDLEVDGDTVPGLWWLPEAASGPRPTILIGHGGTQHKRVPNVLSLGRRLVRHLGYTAVAIDAPGHGDRITDPDAARAAQRNLQRRIAEGRRSDGAGAPMADDPDAAAAMAARSAKGVREWKAVVDELQKHDVTAEGPVGYWGVSMGTAIGLPFVASEPRISAAVLGLLGLGGRFGGDAFEQAARSLEIPVLFLFQWDDELMSRESGLALFDAIGSVDKSMHVNPGGHVAMPLHERDAVEAFFARTLGTVG